MRSTDVENQVPQVSAAQLKFDRTLKHVRKLRWIDYWDGRSFQPHVRVPSRINFDIFLIGISPCQSLREIAQG